MLAALDFGSSLTKALLFDGREFRFFRFSLSYSPQLINRKNVLESLRMLQKLAATPLIDAANRPLGKIYVSTALPLFGPAAQENEPYQNVPVTKIIEGSQIPVLDCGYQFIHYRDRFSVQRPDTSKVLSWLPFKAGISEVANYTNNRRIYSNVLPIYPRDLYIEQGLARESLVRFQESQEGLEIGDRLVITGSIFTTSPYVCQSLLIILDSLEFSGKLDVLLDRLGCLVPLEILRQYEPGIFDQIPPKFQPSFLGSLLRFPNGAQVEINLGFANPLRVNVERSSLFMFPLKGGDKASLSVFEKSKKPAKFEISGGEVGCIIDCRGRPLSLPADTARRISALKEWEESVGANGRIFSV